MLFNVAIISTLVAAVTAAPAPVPQTATNPGSTYSWDVSGWEAGCSRGGCYYNFNVTGAATGTSPTIPAFLAYCHGYEYDENYEHRNYQPCEIIDDLPANRGVSAKLLPADIGTGAHLQVSYRWSVLEEPSTYYNYTGRANSTYNQFVSPTLNFTIPVTEAYGVA